MKRAPSPRPPWIETCAIEHGSGSIIDFPMVQDLAALLWVINLGCIDLNQWYARCDDVDRPDYLHFDLDPGEGATFERVRETGLIVRDALDDAAHAGAGEDDRLPRAARVCADRARARAEGRVAVREGAGHGACCPAPGAHHGGIPGREAAERAGARGLQPERVGPHARVDLLGAPAPARARVGPDHVDRARSRRRRSRTSGWTPCRRGSRAWAICGSPCCRREADSICARSSERRGHRRVLNRRAALPPASDPRCDRTPPSAP